MAIFVLLWPFNQLINLNSHVKIKKLIQTETETVKRLEIFSAQLSSGGTLDKNMLNLSDLSSQIHEILNYFLWKITHC